MIVAADLIVLKSQKSAAPGFLIKFFHPENSKNSRGAYGGK